MCLVVGKIRDVFGQHPLVVTGTPIQVYKIITCSNRPLYFSDKLMYVANKTYREPRMRAVACGDLVVVNEGFHAFLTLEAAFGEEEGGKAASLDRHIKTVKFAIPIGARYYLSRGDKIVSDTIIAGDLRRVHRR